MDRLPEDREPGSAPRSAYGQVGMAQPAPADDVRLRVPSLGAAPHVSSTRPGVRWADMALTSYGIPSALEVAFSSKFQ